MALLDLLCHHRELSSVFLSAFVFSNKYQPCIIFSLVKNGILLHYQ